MQKPDRMRDHLASVLMDMCVDARLDDVTVSTLASRAGVARQTFYNHFQDINELICYAAARPLMSGGYPFADRRNTTQAYASADTCRAFCRQLPYQAGQNNFRQALGNWLVEIYRAAYVTPDLSQHDREYRLYAIDLFCLGQIEAYMKWLANDMATPVETVIEVLYDLMPAFITQDLEAMAQPPDEYPK